MKGRLFRENDLGVGTNALRHGNAGGIVIRIQDQFGAFVQFELVGYDCCVGGVSRNRAVGVDQQLAAGKIDRAGQDRCLGALDMMLAVKVSAPVFEEQEARQFTIESPRQFHGCVAREVYGGFVAS